MSTITALKSPAELFAEWLAAMDAEISATGTNWTQVCAAAGVSRAQPDRWHDEAPKTFEVMQRAYDALTEIKRNNGSPDVQGTLDEAAWEVVGLHGGEPMTGEQIEAVVTKFRAAMVSNVASVTPGSPTFPDLEKADEPAYTYPGSDIDALNDIVSGLDEKRLLCDDSETRAIITSHMRVALNDVIRARQAIHEDAVTALAVASMRYDESVAELERFSRAE